MKFVFFMFLVPVSLLASDFSDDFESFNTGDDISSSASWLNAINEGNFVIEAEGSNNVAESSWDGFDSILYASAGGYSDGSISADVKVSGSGAIFGLFARAHVLNGAYAGGIAPIAPSLGITFIAYTPLSGEPIILQQDYIYLAANTWYSLSFEVTGLSPVSLSVSIDGTTTSEYQDNVYNLDSGFNGVVCGYESSEPMFIFDNYVVDDFSTSLERVSFGSIKALFR